MIDVDKREIQRINLMEDAAESLERIADVVEAAVATFFGIVFMASLLYLAWRARDLVLSALGRAGVIADA